MISNKHVISINKLLSEDGWEEFVRTKKESFGLALEAAKRPRKSQESERNGKKVLRKNHCCKEVISQGRRRGEENSNLENQEKALKNARCMVVS